VNEGGGYESKAVHGGKDHWDAAGVRSCPGPGKEDRGGLSRSWISEQSYFRWRREYGGLRTTQAKRIKDLERENSRLKKAVADLTLDKLILREALEGNY